MTTIELTEPEYAEWSAHHDVTEPPAKCTIWGSGRIRPVQAEAYSRTEGPPGWGWSANYHPLVAGEVEVPQETCYALLDVPGATLSVATAEKILTAAGELPDGDRRFSLRFRFDRFGKGRT